MASLIRTRTASSSTPMSSVSRSRRIGMISRRTQPQGVCSSAVVVEAATATRNDRRKMRHTRIRKKVRDPQHGMGVACVLCHDSSLGCFVSY